LEGEGIGFCRDVTRSYFPFEGFGGREEPVRLSFERWVWEAVPGGCFPCPGLELQQEEWNRGDRVGHCIFFFKDSQLTLLCIRD
jgi:hypothetical protein